MAYSTIGGSAACRIMFYYLIKYTMAKIEDIIKELQSLQQHWVTEVTRANEDRSKWGSYIRVTETEDEDWKLSDAVIEISQNPFTE